MIKEIIFIFILSIKLFQSIKITDFCYQISIEKEVIKCKENKRYNYQCFEGLCSVNRYSCQSIKLFSAVKDFQKKGQNTGNNEKLFKKFSKLVVQMATKNECGCWE